MNAADIYLAVNAIDQMVESINGNGVVEKTQLVSSRGNRFPFCLLPRDLLASSRHAFVIKLLRSLVTLGYASLTMRARYVNVKEWPLVNQKVTFVGNFGNWIATIERDVYCRFLIYLKVPCRSFSSFFLPCLRMMNWYQGAGNRNDDNFRTQLSWTACFGDNFRSIGIILLPSATDKAQDSRFFRRTRLDPSHIINIVCQLQQTLS